LATSIASPKSGASNVIIIVAVVIVVAKGKGDITLIGEEIRIKGADIAILIRLTSLYFQECACRNCIW